jgi:hypothetical protein
VLDAENLEHVLGGQRLEIKPIGRVVVGAHRLRIAIDHDRLEPRVAEREGGMAAAIVELDALPDPVGPAAEDDDLAPLGNLRLVDRLYFEPLTAEDVLEIVAREGEKGELLGVIVQLGGQTPLKLAQDLQRAGVPILGTSPDSIDLAEDRERFAKLVGRLALKQPANGIARSRDEALHVAERIGYPVLLRPSYVLGGRGMEVVDGPEQLDHYIATAVAVSGRYPVLIDR